MTLPPELPMASENRYVLSPYSSPVGHLPSSGFATRVRPGPSVRWRITPSVVSVLSAAAELAWWMESNQISTGPAVAAPLQRSLAHGVAVLLMHATIVGVVLPAAWQGAGSTRLLDTSRAMSESRGTL